MPFAISVHSCCHGDRRHKYKSLLFLDVIASFSRTIFKRGDCFSHLNVFNVKFLRNWGLFPVCSFELTILWFDMCNGATIFQIRQEIKKLESILGTPFLKWRII